MFYIELGLPHRSLPDGRCERNLRTWHRLTRIRSFFKLTSNRDWRSSLWVTSKAKRVFMLENVYACFLHWKRAQIKIYIFINTRLVSLIFGPSRCCYNDNGLILSLYRTFDIFFFIRYEIRSFTVIVSFRLLFEVLYNLGHPATFKWFWLKKFVTWLPRQSRILPLFTFNSCFSTQSLQPHPRPTTTSYLSTSLNF